MNKMIGFFTGTHNLSLSEKVHAGAHLFSNWRIAGPLLIALLACGILFVF